MNEDNASINSIRVAIVEDEKDPVGSAMAMALAASPSICYGVDAPVGSW